MRSKRDGRGARRDRTRAAILASADELFHECGYAATTVTQIAERARVSERAVYAHFSSKEDLLFDHVHRFSELAWLVAERTASADPRMRIDQAMRALIDAACTDESLMRQARTRAALGTSGRIPRSLATHLVTLAVELTRRVVDSTGASPGRVAPMVGAAIGAVEAAGLVAVNEKTSPAEVHGQMTAALESALAGFEPADELHPAS